MGESKRKNMFQNVKYKKLSRSLAFSAARDYDSYILFTTGGVWHEHILCENSAEAERG